MKARSLVLATAAALAVSVGACSADTGASNDCLIAFRNAEPRAEPPYGASTLDDAVRACTSLAEWLAAWEQVPASHPEGTDPRSFLLERCADADLELTRLCREVNG